jgi:hypothetical protein
MCNGTFHGASCGVITVWRGLYFKWLANHVYEPFVEAWHKQDLHALLAEYGFKLETDEHGCPLRFVVSTKIKSVE